MRSLQLKIKCQSLAFVEAQLMCCLSGGSLYQHIQDGTHHERHNVITYDGQNLITSSCHHQAMNLNGTKHELLAWDSKPNTNVFDEHTKHTSYYSRSSIFSRNKLPGNSRPSRMDESAK